MEKMGQHYDFTAGLVMALYIQVFGSHHYIFAAYLLLNILDWLTGWYKAGKKKEVSSKVGLRGILKKTGYWVIILMDILKKGLAVTEELLEREDGKNQK